MNSETIREYTRRQPFEAFVMRLSNGDVHEVRHPECVLVTKTKVIVYDPDADRTTQVALIHVNSVESLQAS